MPVVVKKHEIGFVTPPERPDLFAKAMHEAIREGKNFKRQRARKLNELANYYTVDNAIDMFLKVTKMRNV